MPWIAASVWRRLQVLVLLALVPHRARGHTKRMPRKRKRASGGGCGCGCGCGCVCGCGCGGIKESLVVLVQGDDVTLTNLCSSAMPSLALAADIDAHVGGVRAHAPLRLVTSCSGFPSGAGLLVNARVPPRFRTSLRPMMCADAARVPYPLFSKRDVQVSQCVEAQQLFAARSSGAHLRTHADSCTLLQPRLSSGHTFTTPARSYRYVRYLPNSLHILRSVGFCTQKKPIRFALPSIAVAVKRATRLAGGAGTLANNRASLPNGLVSFMEPCGPKSVEGCGLLRMNGQD